MSLINAILELTFNDGLAVVGFLIIFVAFVIIFVAFVLVWAWTQYLVTEAALDIREWRQNGNAIKDARVFVLKP